jgi:mRNA interferase MazF
MTTHPGDVWLADLGIAGKIRPVVIVSREDDNPPRQLVLCVPLTTQDRSTAYEVPMGKLRFLDHACVANVQGLGSLPVVRLELRLGVLPADLIEKIRAALRYAMVL